MYLLGQAGKILEDGAQPQVIVVFKMKSCLILLKKNLILKLLTRSEAQNTKCQVIIKLKCNERTKVGTLVGLGNY